MKETQFVKPIISFITVGITLGALHINAHAYGNNLSEVFDDIDISAGQTVGELSGVNSDIELGDNVTARAISTVNGDISMGYGVRIASINAVNGDIKADENLFVERSIATVNGDIHFDDGSEVGTDIGTVNGDIVLDQVTVGHNVTTVNGDITLEDATRISGDVVFKKNNNNYDWDDSDKPTLRIEDNVSIDGRIILNRKVNLDIPDSMLDKVEYRYNH